MDMPWCQHHLYLNNQVINILFSIADFITGKKKANIQVADISIWIESEFVKLL